MQPIHRQHHAAPVLCRIERLAGITGNLPFITPDEDADNPFGGNPPAVFTHAPELSNSAMQAIAAKVNLRTGLCERPRSDIRPVRSPDGMIPASIAAMWIQFRPSPWRSLGNAASEIERAGTTQKAGISDRTNS